MKSMEIEENSNSTSATRENGFHIRVVAPEESGKGLPYAPENWPKPGDVWGWRVGKRITITGHYLDRFLYPPKRFSRIINLSCKRPRLANKLSVERYVRKMFPDADINAFFASFSWKIPSKNSLVNDRAIKLRCQSDALSCKAGNKMCNNFSLKDQPLVYMPCDLCCSIPHFCRSSSCVLCSKIVSSKSGEYSYIRCAALVGEGCICAHVAHIECALRTGNIGMDAKYYCQRCEERTDLIPHVKRLLQSCKHIDDLEEIEKMLNIGACILRGSEKPDAKKLLRRIKSAIKKLKRGTVPRDIWKVDEDSQAINPGVTPNEDASSGNIASVSSDVQSKSAKLDEEVNWVLLEFQKSQEIEYEIAEKCLYEQTKYIQRLYRKLDKKASELACDKSNTNAGEVTNDIQKRMEQIECEVKKLEEMKKVGEGLGMTPKSILERYFDM